MNSIDMVLLDKKNKKRLVKFEMLIGLRAVLPVAILKDNGSFFEPGISSDEKLSRLHAFLNSRLPEKLPGEDTSSYDRRMASLLGIDYGKTSFGRMDEDVGGVLSFVNGFKNSGDDYVCIPENSQAFYLVGLDENLYNIITAKGYSECQF